ncbi:MAG: hypothetical protein M0006_13975 [Magnetospirillum sp.]|nr:hypothetical protein [Magnetospirillum sp.]
MPAREDRMLQLLTGGSGMEALGGLAALILSILGLVGVAPRYMVSIAPIIIGAAMMVSGMAAAAEFAQAASPQERAATAEIGGGVSLEVLGGISAVVLGILALLNIAPQILLPIAAIVIGAGLAFSANIPARMAELHSGSFAGEPATSRVTGFGAGTQVLVGLSAIVLGVLALVGIAPLVLTVVAFLSASVSLLLTGFAVGGTMTAMLSR